MTYTNTSVTDLAVDDSVKLTLRAKGTRPESVIHGTVTEITPSGNRRVTLSGNRNSVVITASTNFLVEKLNTATAGERLRDEYPVGTVFTYLNKFGKTKKWVKTAPDRFTRIDADSSRPATSFSSLGFPGDFSKVRFISEA